MESTFLCVFSLYFRTNWPDNTQNLDASSHKVSAGTKFTLFVIYICVFAFMSPIGIGIGIGIGELAAGSVGYTATTGILQGRLAIDIGG